MKSILLLMLLSGSVLADHVYYVSTNGSDSWSGTLAIPNGGLTDGPFLTVIHARDTVRAINGKTNSFTVYIEDGNYFMDTPIVFGSQDAGSTTFQIAYKAYPGAHPRLIGGRKLSVWSAVTNPVVLSQLTPSAQTNVQVADLSSLPTLFQLAGYGYPDHTTPTGWMPINELYFNSTPMTVARYPNGTNNWLYVGTVGFTNTFVCTNSNPYTWSSTNGVLAQGYFRHDYANAAYQVYVINPTNHTIVIDPKSALQTGTPVANQRYFFLNILAELDQAGEYYIDRTVKKVYFWPPTPIASGEVLFGTSTNIIQCLGTSNLNFSGLTLEASTKYLMTVENSVNVKLDHCTLRNTSGKGLYVFGSTGSGIDHSTLTGSGQAEIYLDGGDRITLFRASNYVTSCTIHDYARLDRTYQPAISMNGVGQIASHNRIYSAPHQAIYMQSGNIHLIEFTEFFNVCYESSDAGAIYAGQSWSQCGSIIRCNYFHDIVMTNGAVDPSRVVSVFLDDGFSGTTVYQNCFNRVDVGIEGGGGRNNIYSNNMFSGCGHIAMSIDQRFVNPGNLGTFQTCTNSLVAMPYKTSPWSNTFPYLLTYLTDTAHILLAMGDVITTTTQTNSTYSIYGSILDPGPYGAGTNYSIVNMYTNGDALYINQPGGNFRLHSNSPLYSLTPPWTDIPFDQIGPVPEVSAMTPTNLRITKAH